MKANLLLSMVVVVLNCFTQAQIASAPTTGTPFASTAYSALMGPQQLQNITISGTATSVDNQVQPVTFTVVGTLQSRFNIGADELAEVRDSSLSVPVGSWRANGETHSMTTTNCWIPVGWLLPQSLVATALGSDASVTYVGREQLDSISVEHLSWYRNITQKNAAYQRAVQQWSLVEIYLDATSHLPVKARFWQHPDDQSELSIPVEVYFSDYRTSSGILIPFRIKQYFQGALLRDVVVQNVTVNQLVAPDYFTLQQ